METILSTIITHISFVSDYLFYKMYGNLTPEEKAKWKKDAEDDKNRYLEEISAYVPAPGYDARGDAILPPPPTTHAYPPMMQPYQYEPQHPVAYMKTLPKKITKTKDPNAPKRNLSAYLIYQNAMRDQFKKDNPEMSFGQLSKHTSQVSSSLLIRTLPRFIVF